MTAPPHEPEGQLRGRARALEGSPVWAPFIALQAATVCRVLSAQSSMEGSA